MIRMIRATSENRNFEYKEDKATKQILNLNTKTIEKKNISLITSNDFRRLCPFVFAMPAPIPRPVLNTVSVSSYSCPKFLYLCILKNLSVDCFQYRRSSVWSYIFLLNGQDKKPKQNSSQTKRHSHQQEAKSARRRTAVSGTLRWLASLHCLLYFLAFDWLWPAVLFFLNWTVCLFVKESPIWNYPN